MIWAFFLSLFGAILCAAAILCIISPLAPSFGQRNDAGLVTAMFGFFLLLISFGCFISAGFLL